MFPIFLLLLQIAILISAQDDALLVNIKNGALRGKYTRTTNGRQIASFTGIRYAKPPLGPLRFKPPVPVDNWKGVFDATKGHPACIQRNVFTRLSTIVGNEDCLFLNVYTPKKSGCFPVMMYIHGCGFTTGSGKPELFGPEVLLNQDVVLVVPNSRLGALGMLSTGDLTVPGNNALKDVALALKWIHTNIKQFGGDPTRVTVFGDSTGASTAHFFMFSPLTKGLFHRVILQSGSALNTWALSNNGTTEKRSKKLGKLFNCPTHDSQEMVECLRKVPAKKIVATDEEFFEWDKDPLVPYRPVIEVDHSGAFLCEHPVDLYRKRKFTDVPLIAGMATHEGSIKSSSIFGVPHLLEEFNEDLPEKIRIILMFSDHSCHAKEKAKKMSKYYFGHKHHLDESSLRNVTNLFTDGGVLNPLNDVIYFHRKYSKHNLYQYLLAYKGATSWCEAYGDTRERDLGVCHGDTASYLFPIPEKFFDRTVGHADAAMRKVLTTLWANFAECGNPTPSQEFCDWLPVRHPECSEYLNIKSPKNLRMEAGIFQDRADFWRRLALDDKIAEAKV